MFQCLPNVEIFFRTFHPKVKFHQKRLQKTKDDLSVQINEYSLSNRVKFHDLSQNYNSYYSGKNFTLFTVTFWCVFKSGLDCTTPQQPADRQKRFTLNNLLKQG